MVKFLRTAMVQVINKIYISIDISKEKSNLCYRRGLEIVREEKCLNDVKALKMAFRLSLKVLGVTSDESLICAECTCRYIYPLTVVCQELALFLWLDDPTRIKDSMCLTRGKNEFRHTYITQLHIKGRNTGQGVVTKTT